MAYARSADADTLKITRAHLEPGGLYDVAGRELTNAHWHYVIRDAMGEPLHKLIKHQQRHLDDPDHPIHQDVADAFHARFHGLWHIDRYAAPIEFYIAKALGVKEEDAPAFQSLPASVQAQVATMLHRNHRSDASEFADDVFENLFLTAGVSSLWNQAAGTAPAANTGASPAGANALYNNGQAMIGVGDSTTAASAGQTDLQAATNKTYKGMDATFPTLPGTGSNQLVLRATFGTSDANYAWQEMVVNNRNGSNSTTSGGTTLDRAVNNQGTKASGSTWVPTFTLSIS